jgi:hypothetical protein
MSTFLKIDPVKEAIEKLSDSQDRLFHNLIEQIKKELSISINKRLEDLLFDYCFNQTEHVKKMIEEEIKNAEPLITQEKKKCKCISKINEEKLKIAKEALILLIGSEDVAELKSMKSTMDAALEKAKLAGEVDGEVLKTAKASSKGIDSLIFLLEN